MPTLPMSFDADLEQLALLQTFFDRNVVFDVANRQISSGDFSTFNLVAFRG